MYHCAFVVCVVMCPARGHVEVGPKSPGEAIHLRGTSMYHVDED